MDDEVKLEVINICKSFKGRNGLVEALCHVNFVVNEGEFVCIVGPSGCGKTTLLNVIAEFEKPDTGFVKVTDRNCYAGRKLVVFQEPSLFPWLSVRGNVEFGLRMHGVNKQRRGKIVADFLDLVGLTRFADSFIHQLSGGMKQKVVLARALALEPDILLMDEPFAALDPQSRESLHSELLQIVEKTKATVLFITHNIDEAIRLADRIIAFSGSPGTVKEEFIIDLPKPRIVNSDPYIKLINAIMTALGVRDVKL